MTLLARTTVRVELVARRTNATVNETIMEATAKVCNVMLDEQKRYNTVHVLFYDTSLTRRFQVNVLQMAMLQGDKHIVL